MAIDLMLEATYKQLGQEHKRREAAERIEHNPAQPPAGFDLKRGGGDEAIEAIRGIFSVAPFLN
jgi:hypothetical protein